MSKLLIVGTVAFDAIETPFGKTGKILGGSATYISLSASNFDVDSAIVSVVGKDLPDSYLEMLKSKSIDITGIEVIEDGKTFFWSGKYDKCLNSRETLVTELNVFEDFKFEVPKKLADAEFLILGNLHPSVQKSILNQMNNKPKMVALDTMNFWIDNAFLDLLDIIKRVDIISINDQEALKLTGEYFLLAAAKKIIKMGPKFVIIKKGEHGALLLHGENIFCAPAFPLDELLDPTGAGDTFIGGLMGYLAETKDFSFENMKRALIIGSNLASFCVEKFGTQGMEALNYNRVKLRLQQFEEITRVELNV